MSQNDDEDFVETMKRLINRGSSSTQQPNSSTPSGASGFDPRGGPPKRDSGQPPQEIPFLNPKHAEEYARIQREKQQQAAAKTGPQPATGQPPACPKVSNPVVLWVSSQWGPREHSAHHRLPRLSTKEMKLHPRAPLQQPIKRELVDQRDPPSQAPHQPQTPQAGKKHQTMKCATFGSTIRTRATGGRTPLISKSGWSLNI